MGKLITSIIVILLILGGVWWFMKDKAPEEATVVLPSIEDAELVGFNFVQDFIAIAPPSENEEAKDRLYNALSADTKQAVSRENIVAQMAEFFGVQDVPDQGVSLENIQQMEDNSLILLLGFNYSSGRVLRALNLVAEDGVWKVRAVFPVEEVAETEATEETPTEPTVAE